MADIRLTADQAAVVENRGGALLVSAAAGSGKTKVLVERLFRYVTDEHCNVDDFLIITYTRAAAAELRGKIAEELNRRLAESPEDAHLQRQMLRVYQADIKTVDAFCTALLRENAHLLAEEGQKRCLTPDFRVLDENEAALVRQRVLSQVLERFYGGLDGAGELLADTLGAGRDDHNLEELVATLYAKLQSHAYPEAWLQEQEAFWKDPGEDIGATPYAGELLSGVAGKAAYWQQMLTGMLARMGEVPAVEKGYGPGFSAAADALGSLARAAERSWAEAAAAPLEFPRLGSVKAAEGGALKDQAKTLWDTCKKEMAKAVKVLRVSDKEAMEDLRAVAPAMLALLSLTSSFSKAYQQEKLRINATDFSDQEHLALKLLVKPEGGPTELGEQVAGRYREIMVDEYQDTNEVQNCIFAAVSKSGENLFTVGDVKQSIYRFRLADPTIFLRNYQTYLPADQAEEGQERKILLSQNFRSRSEVLDGSNFIFGNIMSPQMGEMAYGAEEALNFGAEYYLPRTDCAVEFHLVDVAMNRGAERPFKRVTAEARAIARRIRRLLEERFPVQEGDALRPCRMEDIVVLMRSPAGRAFELGRALEEQGIPCSADTTGDFFATMEVAVIYNLLQIVDNPRQDVPLISVLRSPLAGFTPDRLAQVRAGTPQGDFYDALCADGGEDCTAFLAELDKLRRSAQDMSLHRLLWHIYNQYNALGIFGAMEGGEERKENLIILFEHARRFESSGYRGVFAFVTQLRRLLEAGKEPETHGKTGSGGIQLMSIHKSKGLEFPIVLLADLSRPFSRMDYQTPVLVHPRLGLGPIRVDLERRIKYPTIARQALESVLRRESKSEEMRILYVAMTRAKEKLILVYSRYGAEKHISSLVPLCSCPARPEAVESCECMGDWLLLPLLCRPEAEPLRCGAEVPLTAGGGAPWEVFLEQGEEYRESSGTALPAAQEDRKELDFDPALLEFEYPYAREVTLPAKLTATQLKGREADSEISEHAALPPRIRPLTRPRFMAGELTAAQRGTATHLVLQYLNFEDRDVASQVERLVQRRLLTKEQAAEVDLEDLNRFLDTPLAQRIRSSPRVLREYRFTLLVDARRYGALSDDRILLQGVVDCCFEEQGKLYVVDFKTDHVFGERLMERSVQYRPQLEAYSEALERVLGQPVGGKFLYFLPAGREVPL